MAAQTNAFKSPFRYNSDSSLQPVNFIFSYFKTNGISMMEYKSNHIPSGFFLPAYYEDYLQNDKRLFLSYHLYKLVFLTKKSGLLLWDQPFYELPLETVQAHTCF